MSTPPAFQFYPKQWLGDDKVMLMSWEAKAMHMHFMCICWQQDPPCSLPDDDAMLMAWVGNPPSWKELKKQIFRAWELKDGRWFQMGLFRVWQKQVAYSLSRQKNASHSHKAHAKHMQSIKQAPEEEEEDEDSLISGGGAGGIPTVEQCRAAAPSFGLPPEEGDEFWNHYNAQGWMNGIGLPITSWTSQMHRWKSTFERKQVGSGSNANGYAPSINSIAQADSVIAEAQKEIERIKSHSENYEWDGGLKKGITLSAQQRISDLRSKITETRKIKTKHT